MTDTPTDDTLRDEPHFVCRDCGTITARSMLLTAPHPFALDDEQVHGCPSCREMDLIRSCDITDCTQQATLGKPSPSGYRWLCRSHQRQETGTRTGGA